MRRGHRRKSRGQEIKPPFWGNIYNNYYKLCSMTHVRGVTFELPASALCLSLQQGTRQENRQEALTSLKRSPLDCSGNPSMFATAHRDWLQLCQHPRREKEFYMHEGNHGFYFVSRGDNIKMGIKNSAKPIFKKKLLNYNFFEEVKDKLFSLYLIS